MPGFAITGPGANRVLVARGTLRPSPITRAYQVRIECREGKAPDVYVEEPKLLRRPEEPERPIPHTYDSSKVGEERPCCFYPALDWDGTRLASATVIPWLMSWLLDYEIWVATGDWYGGGVHPNVKGATQRLLRKARKAK